LAVNTRFIYSTGKIVQANPKLNQSSSTMSF
jgi:hypothetical protein